MNEKNRSTKLAQERTDKAEERTDLAEDRTLLANERTFAGWTRTGFASIGLGLGFQAIFQKVEPSWVAKGIASIFVALGVWIIWKAYGRASQLIRRQSPNEVNAAGRSAFLRIAVASSIGSAVLLYAVWALV